MNVLVHGGAGAAPEDPDARQRVLDRAAAKAVDADAPLDAIERAVTTLESSPMFNAGHGGVAEIDGRIRTDAGVMTDDRRIGAVCSVEGLEHAVSAARVVLEETPHIMLSGQHARNLAREFDIDVDDDLRSESVRQGYEAADPPDDLTDQLDWAREEFGGLTTARDHDTVGAVAVTEDGDLAAATSTGGRWFALAGRVGDTPQVGSGFYACPTAAASVTGAGEAIAKSLLSRRVTRHVEDGVPVDEAVTRGIDEFAEMTGERAGVILADRDGNLASHYNTEEMQTSRARSRNR